MNKNDIVSLHRCNEMFTSKRVKVNCIDGQLKVPQSFIDEWSSYKGMLEISEELSLDVTVSMLEKLLGYQFYFEFAKVDSTTRINNQDLPFDKKYLLDLTIEVYKLAHFLGVNNILEFVTNNILYMPDVKLTHEFFEEWNADQFSKVEFNLNANRWHFEKTVDSYLSGNIKLEELLRKTFFKMAEKENFEAYKSWNLCHGATPVNNGSALATHISPNFNFMTKVGNLYTYFYIKYKWYLNRISFLCKSEHTLPYHYRKVDINSDDLNLKEDVIYNCVNVDPVYIVMNVASAITCVDMNGKRCILVKDSGSTKILLWHWDPENIDIWTTNCYYLDYKFLPEFKPDPNYKILEVDPELYKEQLKQQK